MSIGTIFLVDDDPGVLRALERFLSAHDFEVQAYGSAEEFLIHHDWKTPGCAVFDVGLGTYNGLDLQRALSRGTWMRPTIFITGRNDIETSVRAMKSGAIDFLTKPIQLSDLVEAVRKAIERDLRDREQLAKLRVIIDRLSNLSRKEMEVLRRVIAGRLNKQIAADLGIAEKTVKAHRGRVMTKMGVRTVPDLIRSLRSMLNRVLSGGSIPDELGVAESLFPFESTGPNQHR